MGVMVGGLVIPKAIKIRARGGGPIFYAISIRDVDISISQMRRYNCLYDVIHVPPPPPPHQSKL